MLVSSSKPLNRMNKGNFVLSPPNGKPFRQGIVDSIAIMIGYIPVAMAFGMTAKAAGLPDWLPPLMSIVMFAGATQFVMIGAIINGGALAWIVGLCALMDARGLFFAPTIEKLVPMGIKKRSLAAFGLTDEVFAITSNKAKEIPITQRVRWYFGLMIGAYLSWCFGTLLGVLLGNWITEHLSFLSVALPFAFPALFFVMVYLNLHQNMFIPIFITFGLTSALCLFFSGGVAIIVGAFCGMGYFYLTQRGGI